MSARDLRSILVGSAVVLAVLAGAACGDDEHVDPLGGSGGAQTTSGSTATASGSTGAIGTASGAGGSDVPTPIRTVIQRDPFGNVAETRNLLWDGDFEWESAFADQYGWLQGQAANIAARKVGPECRSGLKCGVLGDDLIGIAVASADRDLYASVWAHPGNGECGAVLPYLLAEGIYDDGADAPIPPTTETPDEAGWCHYELTAPQRDDKAYLFVVSIAPQPSLVDDAVVREADAEESRRVAHHAAWVPSAETAEKLDAARDVIRKWRRPHDGGPQPVRDAVQRWGRGEGRKRFVAAPKTARGGSR